MRQKRGRVADVVQCLPAAGKGSTHERPGFEVEDIFLALVAFGNWLCESFVVVLLVFRFVSSPPSQWSGITHWNFTNGVLLLPIYWFSFFLLITCGEKTWVLSSVAKRYSKNKQELRVIVEKVELKASPQHGEEKKKRRKFVIEIQSKSCSKTFKCGRTHRLPLGVLQCL